MENELDLLVSILRKTRVVKKRSHVSNPFLAYDGLSSYAYRRSSWDFDDIDSWSEPGLSVDRDLFKSKKVSVYVVYEMSGGNGQLGGGDYYVLVINPKLAPKRQFPGIIESGLDCKVPPEFWTKLNISNLVIKRGQKRTAHVADKS